MIEEATALFEEFHKFAPRKVSAFPKPFHIPSDAFYAGPAIHVLYESDKNDPVTLLPVSEPIAYIHDHKEGVKVYRLDDEDVGPLRRVPRFISDATALTFLGKCLGFAYIDSDGDEVQAECEGTSLYAVPPDGRGLVVVDRDRYVTALIWGGSLRVEGRGIVG